MSEAHAITRYSYNGGRNAECVCSCGETICRSSEQDTPHGERHDSHTPPPTREPIRLTDEERERIDKACWQGVALPQLLAAVESILAARLAGGPTLADAWDEQLRRVEGWHHAGLWHASCPGVPTNIHLTRPRQLEAKCRLCGFALVAMDGDGEAIHVPPRTPESEDTE